MERTCQNDGPEVDLEIHGRILEFCSEAGEVLDISTKASRKRYGSLTEQDKTNLYDELSDCLWGIQALLNALGRPSLKDLQTYNQLKLLKRRGEV